MTRKKILMLNDDPLLTPEDGGKQRAWHMRESLKSDSSNVIYKAYYDAKHYLRGEVEKADVPISGAEKLRPKHIWQIDDYMVGQTIVGNADFMQAFIDSALNIAPDVIMIEHPWLWAPTKEFLKRTSYQCKLIYSSQNVEFKLKEQILKEHSKDNFVIDVLPKIKDLEIDLAVHSDLVIAASPEDGQVYIDNGAKNVVAIECGTNNRIPNILNLIKTKLKFWLKFNKKQFALFVGSEHPPNITGFCDYAVNYAHLIPADAVIVVVGYCCTRIKEILQQKLSSQLFKKFLFFGRISDEHLASLYRLASCILLPILEGGGSNIKTAEALVNGKKILATHFAFRGFESYIKDADVIIADDPEVFSQQLQKVLTNSNIEQVKIQRSELFWQNRFTQVLHLIEAL